MDCRHNTTDADKFSVFVTTYILPREEINRRANTYQNFLNKDGTPKSRNRHKLEGEYTLAYLQGKIVDDNLKERFQELRRWLEKTYPAVQEEYTKKRLSYWTSSNQCLFSLEPHRKSLWFGMNGRKDLKGCQKYFDRNKTFFRITGKTSIDKVTGLCP